MRPVVDLGEGPTSPLCWVKQEEIREGGKAGRASKTTLSPPPTPPSSMSESTTGETMAYM